MIILVKSSTIICVLYKFDEVIHLIDLYIKKSVFQTLIDASVFNNLGNYLYLIVFIIYAAQLTENSSLAVSLASLGLLIPSLSGILTGYYADQVTHPYRRLVRIKLIQIGLFAIITVGMLLPKGIILFLSLWLLGMTSDILGNFSGLIVIKLFKLTLAPQNMNSAFSLSQGLANLTDIFGQALGAGLLTLLHQQFALIALLNLLTFLVSLIILHHAKDQLVDITSPTSVTVQRPQFGLTTKLAAKSLANYHGLLTLIILLTIANLLSGSIEALQNVALLKTPELWLNHYGMTLVCFNVAFTGGLLVGTLSANDFLRHFKLTWICLLLGIAMTIFALLFADPVFSKITTFILLTVAFSIAFLAGKIGPRLSALVVNQVKTSQLSETIGFINTLLTLGAPLGAGSFLYLMNQLGAQIGWLIFAGSSAVFVATTLILPFKNWLHLYSRHNA